MRKLTFYFSHALTDLRVNRRRTLFTLLCIAAGVAAVVSLMIVGRSLLFTLTASAQEKNRADIRLDAPVAFANPPADLVAQGVREGALATYETGFGYVEHSIAPAGLDQIAAWLDQRYPGALVALTTEQQAGDPRKLQIKTEARGTQAYGPRLFIVDRERYPLYGTIATLDGTPLAEALALPGAVVLNESLASKLKLQLGDTVTLTSARGQFTVQGVVPDSAEAGGDAQSLALSGYIYVDQVTAAAAAERPPTTRAVYLRLADEAPVAAIGDALGARFPYLSIVTTDRLVGENAELQRLIALLAQVMGFLALLIGGIGIANTMTVVVRRRVVEVAVLKTVGVQGHQIAALFLTQAALMGLLGSVAGVVMGYLLPLALREVAGGLLATDLRLRFGLEPAVIGLVMGVVVTTVFGVLPTLGAARVRPITVLRPGEPSIERLGGLPAGLAILGMLAAVGLVATPIFGDPLVALGAVAGGLAGAGALAALLTLALAVVAPLLARVAPTELQIGLRQLCTTRARSVSTTLALATGALMLGLVLLVLDTVTGSIERLTTESLGGTAQVIVPHRVTANELVELLRAGEVPGYHGHFTDRMYQAVLVRVETAGGTLTPDELRRRGEAELGRGRLANLTGQLSAGIAAMELTPRVAARAMAAGRPLDPSDAGRPVVVLSGTPEVRGAKLQPGDRLTFAFGGPGGEELTFELVGIVETSGTTVGPVVQMPYDALPDAIRPQLYTLTVEVDTDQLPALERLVERTPGAVMLTTAELSRMLAALLRQFAALPLVVTLICLIVSAVVIANTVALGAMERRREIAVMKALGLGRGRVLGMLLGESAVLGLIGGLVGSLLALGALLALRSLGLAGSGGQAEGIPYGLLLGLLVLCCALATLSALATAWRASGQPPVVVLRDG